MIRSGSIQTLVAALVLLGSACSSDNNSSVTTPATGGTTVKTGGTTATGGTTPVATGGNATPNTGGAATGGTKPSTGGAAPLATGGNGPVVTTGGNAQTGGSVTPPATGGVPATGGTSTPPATGGVTSTGGSQPRDGGPPTVDATSPASDGSTPSGDAVPSAGCGKASALKNNGYNTLGSRQYYLRLPATYDNNHAHRLILSLHGATGKGTDVAPGFWGLYALANNSTIFIAPDASGGLWSAASDTTFVSDILKAVEADRCIDTSRVMLEGFSQGAARSWTLACSLPKTFRAVVGHSGGGVANPSSCQPVAYFGSGGLQENVTQTTQSDQFAKWNGCTIETFAKPATGSHACYDYKGCSAGHPVRWCPYDGPHTPSPNDSGKSSSWMPSETWPFLSQF